jgi:hypothetical protein
MALSIPEIIEIAQVSQYLCLNDIQKSGLYGGGQDLQLPNKIYMVRKNIEWYWGENPATPISNDLYGASNYLIALCGKYSIAAQNILGIGQPVGNIILTENVNYLITEQ